MCERAGEDGAVPRSKLGGPPWMNVSGVDRLRKR